MSRKPNIKWRKSDAEKLAKEIQRFNNKIYRTRHAHPELSNILPETIKKADRLEMMKQLQASPRSEYNKTINSLARFNKRGAEKPITSDTGNTITNWERKEVGYKVAQINRSRTMERKAVENMEATTRGEPIGLKRGEMGSERMNALKPKTFNFNKIKRGKEWEKYKASVDKLSSPTARLERMDKYKENYIEGLRRAFGEYADDIIGIIEELPSEIVVKTFYSEQEATISFFYEPQDMDKKLNILDGIWNGVADKYGDDINR